MYEGLDVLEDFYETCIDQYEGKNNLPSPPERENLDLQPVVESDYFLT